jgi:hypothetical protein
MQRSRWAAQRPAPRSFVLVTPAAGSLTIVISNLHATVAVNGTLVVSYGSFPA